MKFSHLLASAALAELVIGLNLTSPHVSVLCDASIYGRPGASDVTSIRRWLPFAGQDEESVSARNAPRLFGEPGFFNPRFRPYQNPYGIEMAQLPKLWKYSM